MNGPEVCNRMRDDWNARAREDAGYYVAFGRRNQDDDEFFATAADVVRDLRRELKRIPPGVNRRALRALEIGCGPGRILYHLAPLFGELHGVDVSDEMIRLGREKLRAIPHAHLHHSNGSDLAAFADESFDFVYSYAVFQHIPSRDVVFHYLHEARRVLKTGGLLRCQLNGLPQTTRAYDTWHGVRISGEEIAAFARDNDFQLLALEGAATQYMWTTLIKRPAGWTASLTGKRAIPEPARIRRVSNCYSSEPVVPIRGRFSAAALWIENLPEQCGLNHLEAWIGDVRGTPFYISAPENDGLRQLNVKLPEGLATGLEAIRLAWLGQPLCAPATLRLIRPGPAVPGLISVRDGVDLLSGLRIVSGCIKVTLEEAANPEEFQAFLDGRPATGLDIFCTDPVAPRYEINFPVPEGVAPGPHTLELRLGRRRFAPIAIDLAPTRA